MCGGGGGGGGGGGWLIELIKLMHFINAFQEDVTNINTHISNHTSK